MSKAKAAETLLEWKLAVTEEMLQSWDTFMAQADEVSSGKWDGDVTANQHTQYRIYDN